ncbi:unnamed protein product [Caenorhabditis bovis]|uniref:RING finger protein 207 n=1 Tax=Caenorhabditis bovis TaxID=2654633 RepID=A0A8S1ED22_9PELO|nr:unnamed protein product [Caenorhabditis bovis]
MELNPLECIECQKEIENPILLQCHHTICRKCLPSAAPNGLCRSCPAQNHTKPYTPHTDKLAAFLLDASKEAMDQCANCDRAKPSMFYCETCQQSLCIDCRQITHQAKMFASHKIINNEERSKVYGSSTCKEHGEPYILYCSDVRKLVCIQCFNGRPMEERHSFISIDQGHRFAVEKIEQAAAKLRFYQSERQEELYVRKKLLDENQANFEEAKNGIYQLCQQIIDTVMATRDKLTRNLEKCKEERSEMCSKQIAEIEALMQPVRLCLLSSQFMCTTASKLDVLQLNGILMKRINSIMDRGIDKLPITSTPYNLEVRTEVAKALEPFLGLSAAWCPISARETSREGSSSNSYKRGAGSYPVLSKIQATIDLAGAFGQLFGKVEHPVRQLVTELAVTGQQVLEIQRDLTTRRCIIESDVVEKLVKSCKKIETDLGMHSAALDGMQSEMQEIWQEQLDRVRRQQIIYREKVEEILSLRETARQILISSKQIAPYVSCILSMNAMIDPKRCHPPDPAPMESICLEISGIEPNSASRIQAIEKEEENRRLNQEAKKKEEIAEQNAVVKSLKHGKTKKNCQFRLLVNTNRERSPGGTDGNLISPCMKRFSSSTVREETNSELDAEEYLDESFELSVDPSEDAADGILMEEARCSSALLLSIERPSSAASLPSLDQLLGRAPLATRVTQNVGFCRDAMLQSLNDVFAQQKPPTPENITVSEENNVLASAVRNSEKLKNKDSTGESLEISDDFGPKDVKSKGKVVRRRVKRKNHEEKRSSIEGDIEQFEKPMSAPPAVPYVPQDLLDHFGDEKLGSFEAKERMLQMLKEKIRMEKIDAEDSE